MKLAECRENYYFFSGEASKIGRSLALSGFAIIWVFKKTGASSGLIFDSDMVNAGVLLVVFLILDMLQYVVAAIIWGVYGRYKECKKIGKDDEFEAHRAINWPALGFFWGKLAVLAVAYFYLIRVIIINTNTFSSGQCLQ